MEMNLLFWVVSCICENSQKDLALHSITASDKCPMCVCIHKVLIKHQKPDLLYEVDFEKAQHFSLCRSSICLHVEVLDLIRELMRGKPPCKYRSVIGLMDGIYEIWCTAWAFGLPQAYFERLPRYIYMGQRDAVPNVARYVESDQSNRARTVTSILGLSSGCHLRALILASSSIMASELYISVYACRGADGD
jgi:hypothetical protein